MKIQNVNGTIRIHNIFKRKISTSNWPYQLKMKIIVPINTSISHILSMQIGNDNINSVSNSFAFKDSSTNRKFNE